MLKLITSTPSQLGIIVIITIILCKFFHNFTLSPIIFLLTIILTLVIYQRYLNIKHNNADNFEETLINISKFIIVTGIFGYIVVMILALFLPGFD
jgi:hypothetical protein